MQCTDLQLTGSIPPLLLPDSCLQVAVLTKERDNLLAAVIKLQGGQACPGSGHAVHDTVPGQMHAPAAGGPGGQPLPAPAVKGRKGLGAYGLWEQQQQQAMGAGDGAPQQQQAQALVQQHPHLHGGMHVADAPQPVLASVRDSEIWSLKKKLAEQGKVHAEYVTQAKVCCMLCVTVCENHV